jgi:hypothetical protein
MRRDCGTDDTGRNRPRSEIYPRSFANTRTQSVEHVGSSQKVVSAARFLSPLALSTRIPSAKSVSVVRPTVRPFVRSGNITTSEAAPQFDRSTKQPRGLP